MKINLKDITNFYQKQLDKYPPTDIRCMGWHDVDEYKRRFEIAAEIADLSGASILDVGCGTGGLYGYLTAQKYKTTYFGVDILPGMITIAQKHYPKGNFEIKNILKDSIPQHDYVFCIGALNITTAHFHGFFMEMVSAMINIARKGVAINFLCGKEYLAHGPYHFEDPEKIRQELVTKHDVEVKVLNDQNLRGECYLYIYKK